MVAYTKTVTITMTWDTFETSRDLMYKARERSLSAFFEEMIIRGIGTIKKGEKYVRTKDRPVGRPMLHPERHVRPHP